MMKANKGYTGYGTILILIGGILAIIFSLFPLILSFLLSRIAGGWIMMHGIWSQWNPGGWMIPHLVRWVFGLVLIGGIITIFLGLIAFYAFFRVRGGKVKSGGLIAIIIGVTLLISTHWIPGTLILIGGILCYTAS